MAKYFVSIYRRAVAVEVDNGAAMNAAFVIEMVAIVTKMMMMMSNDLSDIFVFAVIVVGAIGLDGVDLNLYDAIVAADAVAGAVTHE